MKDNAITQLFKSKKTVFSSKDLVLIWGISNEDYLKTKIYRLIKQGQLIRIKQGLYAIDKNYDDRELANKLITPSYISLQTVLVKEGVVFQFDQTIYSVSKISKNFTLDGKKFSYLKIKDKVLFNPLGIERAENHSIASKERAVLDTLYLKKDFYFDNLKDINWKRCQEIVQIYNNQNLITRFNKLRKLYA